MTHPRDQHRDSPWHAVPRHGQAGLCHGQADPRAENPDAQGMESTCGEDGTGHRRDHPSGKHAKRDAGSNAVQDRLHDGDGPSHDDTDGHGTHGSEDAARKRRHERRAEIRETVRETESDSWTDFMALHGSEKVNLWDGDHISTGRRHRGHSFEADLSPQSDFGPYATTDGDINFADIRTFLRRRNTHAADDADADASVPADGDAMGTTQSIPVLPQWMNQPATPEADIRTAEATGRDLRPAASDEAMGGISESEDASADFEAPRRDAPRHAGDRAGDDRTTHPIQGTAAQTATDETRTEPGDRESAGERRQSEGTRHRSHARHDADEHDRPASYPVPTGMRPTRPRSVFSQDYMLLVNHHVLDEGHRKRRHPHRNLDDSLRLIDDLTNRPMDPLFTDAMLVQHDEKPAAKVAMKTISFLICVIIGLSFVIAVQTLHENSREKVRQEEANQLTESTQRYEDLQSDVEDLRSQIETLSKYSTTTVKTPDSDRIRNGTVEVEGPGISVTLADPATLDDSQDGSSADGKRKVADTDIQLFVDRLWASGAEAISVNGQRLGPQTSVRGAGGKVLVGFVAVQSPYVIEAIGNPATMTAGVDSGHNPQLYQSLDTYGIRVTISKQGDIHLSANAISTLRYAQEDTDE